MTAITPSRIEIISRSEAGIDCHQLTDVAITVKETLNI